MTSISWWLLGCVAAPEQLFKLLTQNLPKKLESSFKYRAMHRQHATGMSVSSPIY